MGGQGRVAMKTCQPASGATRLKGRDGVRGLCLLPVDGFQLNITVDLSDPWDQGFKQHEQAEPVQQLSQQSVTDTELSNGSPTLVRQDVPVLSELKTP